MQSRKLEQPLGAVTLDPERRRRVRRTTLAVTAVALLFYVGFIVMMLLRATH